jgi:hypothetical protein
MYLCIEVLADGIKSLNLTQMPVFISRLLRKMMRRKVHVLEVSQMSKEVSTR